MMVVGHFSAGVSSFVALWLIKEELDEILYVHINDQEEDSVRFKDECEKVLEMKITELQHPLYKDVDAVCRQFKYINGPGGARCTYTLKKQTRKIWENEHPGTHTYVWGIGPEEAHRVDQIENAMPTMTHRFPLIEQDITKAEAHGICQALGIARPRMYDLGFQNNNCIGCVKGGMWYWNRIRELWPDVFESRAKMERDIGATCLKESYMETDPVTGKKKRKSRRLYLDELEPGRGRKEDEVGMECGIMCEVITD